MITCQELKNMNVTALHLKSKGGEKKQNRKTNAFTAAAAAAKSRQSCPTLCDPIDSSLPGSFVPGIL